MSGTRPTLNDYFARARRDGTTSTDSTLGLLAEYRAKAERRRRRRIVAVTAFSCVLLGAIGFEFTAPFAPVQQGAPASAHNAPSGTVSTGQPAQEPAPDAGRRIASAHTTLQARPGAGTRSRTPADRTEPVYTMRSDELHSSGELSSASSEIDIGSTALREVAPALRRATGPKFIEPAQERSAWPVFPFGQDGHETPQSIALTAGARYGTAAADISAINDQLADLNFPTLRSQFEQATVQLGVAIGNITVGVAYTSPYAESVTGHHPPSSSVVNGQQNQLSVTTTLEHKRWSAFSEYSFALTDDISLDAGAQISFTAYELEFESNYAPSIELTPHDETPERTNREESWEQVWRQVGAPSDQAYMGEKLAAARPLEGISTKSIGISPTIGLSWRALPALNLQCRFSYLVNVQNDWRSTSTGAAVNGVDNQLRLNEYSISIGASFYQWLF